MSFCEKSYFRVHAQVDTGFSAFEKGRGEGFAAGKVRHERAPYEVGIVGVRH